MNAILLNNYGENCKSSISCNFEHPSLLETAKMIVVPPEVFGLAHLPSRTVYMSSTKL